MTDIFTLWRNRYNIRNICLFGSENPRSMHFGVDTMAFRVSQLWQKAKIKQSKNKAKAKIKLGFVTFARVTCVKDLSPM